MSDKISKETAFIIKKFNAFGHDKIAEFIRDVKSELTLETWCAVIKRGKNPEIKTLLKMASDLNFTTDELVKLLLARGEKQIAAWIAPTTLTSEEQTIIEKYRTLNGDPQKTRLVKDLLNNIGG